MRLWKLFNNTIANNEFKKHLNSIKYNVFQKKILFLNNSIVCFIIAAFQALNS